MLSKKISVMKTDLDPPNVKNVTLFFLKASLTDPFIASSAHSYSLKEKPSKKKF